MGMGIRDGKPAPPPLLKAGKKKRTGRGPRDSIAGRAAPATGKAVGVGIRDGRPAPPPLLRAGKKKRG